MTDEAKMSAIDAAMAEAYSTAPPLSAIDAAMAEAYGGEVGGENLGYLQSIAVRKKREEQEKQDALSLIKTDTLQETITRELGVPQGMVDDSGADYGMRVNFSFSDDDADMREKFKKTYPQGEIYRLNYNRTGTYRGTGEEIKSAGDSSVLVYRKKAYDDDGNVLPITEESPVITIEGEGSGWGDTADIVGPAFPLAASLAAGVATGGTSVLFSAAALGVGYAAGELAKHEINIFAYDSNMSQKEALTDAAREGRDMAVIMAVTGGLIRGVKMSGRWVADRAAAKSSPALRAVQARAMRFVEEEGVATLNANQLLKESMVLQKLGAQAEALSGPAKRKAQEQLTGVADVAIEAAKGSIEVIGARLQAISRNVYRSLKNDVIRTMGSVTGRVTLEQGGLALTEGGRAWQKSTKGKIDVAWKKVEESAAIAKPKFSLDTQVTGGQASVREVVADIRTFVNAELSGAAAARMEASGINVAETPLGKLRGIVDDIDNMASTQTNYEAIKQLKTRTGAVIEQWPWESSVNASQARRLYGVLSDVLMNPVNKSKAITAFTTNVARATGVSRAYYDILDDQAIRAIIRSESPHSLAANLGTPGQLTPNVRNLINEMPEAYAKKFKEAVVYHDILLNPKSSVGALDRWVRVHPEGLDFIAPRVTRKELWAAAKRMDDLRKSNLVAILDNDVKASEVARTILLKSGTRPMETELLAAQIGPEGRDLLRRGIYHDIVDRAVSNTGKYGEPSLSWIELNRVIYEYRKSGAWSHLLNDVDRVKLVGMRSYLELIYAGATDMGVSLEANSIIAGLKSPSTFVASVGALTANRIVARTMMSDAFTRSAVLRKPGVPVSLYLSGPSWTSKVRIVSMIGEALWEGVEPGQNVEYISPYLDAAYEAALGFDIQKVGKWVSELPSRIPKG